MTDEAFTKRRLSRARPKVEELCFRSRVCQRPFNSLTSALRAPCMSRGQREQAYVHIYIIDSRIKYMTYSTNKYKGEKIEVMDMDSLR